MLPTQTPSLSVTLTHLLSPAADSEEQITTRLRNAQEELRSVEEAGLYDYVIVNNGALPRGVCSAAVLAILSSCCRMLVAAAALPATMC